MQVTIQASEIWGSSPMTLGVPLGPWFHPLPYFSRARVQDSEDDVSTHVLFTLGRGMWDGSVRPPVLDLPEATNVDTPR